LQPWRRKVIQAENHLLLGGKMKKVLCGLWFILALIALWLPASAAETFQLTILHTNDLHGRMRPITYERDSGYLSGKHPDMGGLARRATLISRLRKEIKHPLMVVDTGDLSDGGPWSSQWWGVPEIEAYNAMHYDLFCAGNHEFKPTFDGTAQMRMLNLVQRSHFPWLAANLTEVNGTRVKGIKPFVVHKFGKVRVGFLGFTPARVATYGWLSGWKIEDPIASAKHWVPLARKECDILILTAHLGEGTCQELIKQVPGIDAVVAGDSHSFIPTPILAKNMEGKEVPIIEAGELGVVLGRFDLTFVKDNGWHLTEAKEQLISITAELPEDRKIRKLLSKYLDQPAPKSAPATQPVPAAG
jgi:2',3'-cyclic-nucleotide 2'-phosphodiesterase (5'-nucleotidase family)